MLIDHITAVFSSLRGSQKCSIETALHQTHDENQITIFVMCSDQAWYGHDGYQLSTPEQSTTGFDDVSDRSDHNVSLGKQ
ncbi:hypothetical protein [Photorhabdus noenieputensis]|uniref:hypothetical protein n=1 Tax=Photorhabdus noenieputensis TaxID=1208607 RepID=UPI001BD5402C|nr:hypothetical protein [Photorhabdus noenieputensis]MCK3669470.1 hypothetical protein [Photorhabdus noenieputensis]